MISELFTGHNLRNVSIDFYFRYDVYEFLRKPRKFTTTETILIYTWPRTLYSVKYLSSYVTTYFIGFFWKFFIKTILSRRQQASKLIYKKGKLPETHNTFYFTISSASLTRKTPVTALYELIFFSVCVVSTSFSLLY